MTGFSPIIAFVYSFNLVLRSLFEAEVELDRSWIVTYVVEKF
jgi:hypothetical protein